MSDLSGGAKSGCVTIQKYQGIPLGQVRHAQSLEALNDEDILGRFDRHV
jgi:hypothetical protein